MIPKILTGAKIDEVIKVSERSTIHMCRAFSDKFNTKIGGSSGSVIAAIYAYFKDRATKNTQTVVTIFPDRGDRYLSTIYDDNWCKQII